MSIVQQEQIVALLEPEVERLGFELADLEWHTGGVGGVLRLFIDSEAGITLDDCAAVSRQVSALLDVEDPIPGEYNLEVSSPGINRRLVKAVHYERFAGSKVKIKLRRVVDGRRNYKGQLVGYDEPNVLVKEGGQTFAVPLQEIDSARVVASI